MIKLIKNKKFDSNFSYFCGIDYPNMWTLENPAVYHVIKNLNNQIVVPYFSLMSQCKYLLFKVEGGIDYKLYFEGGDCVQLYFYDYLDFQYDDVEKNNNYLLNFYQPQYQSSYDYYHYYYSFSFDNPTFILMKIVPKQQYLLQYNLKFWFNNIPLQFDYSSHWERDYNKVLGESWDCNGKINALSSLQQINRISEEIIIDDDQILQFPIFHISLNNSLNTETGQYVTPYGNISYNNKYDNIPSVYFNGNSYIYVENISNMPSGKEARSISFWVRLSSQDSINKYIVSMGFSSTNKRYGIGFYENSKIQIWGYENTTSYNFDYKLKRWYHIVVTYENDNQSLYVNGNLIGTQKHTNLQTIKSGFAIACGIGDWTSKFVGYIADVQLYNIVISENKIKQLYNLFKQEVEN